MQMLLYPISSISRFSLSSVCRRSPLFASSSVHNGYIILVSAFANMSGTTGNTQLCK